MRNKLVVFCISDNMYPAVALREGDTLVDIQVDAVDGSSSIYTIQVFRPSGTLSEPGKRYRVYAGCSWTRCIRICDWFVEKVKIIGLAIIYVDGLHRRSGILAFVAAVYVGFQTIACAQSDA